MFTNYQNPYQETPNNLYKANRTPYSYTSKLHQTVLTQPYELYDAKGQLEGYFWKYGDTVNLEFNIDGEITLENDAYVLKHINQDPNTLRIDGMIGQRCYNIIDLKSWTCVALENRVNIWKEDSEFTYPSYGKSVFISASDYIKDKVITIALYNFRVEEIHRITVPASTQVSLVINKELSKKLVKGIYYCSLEVSGTDMHQTIFAPQDCKLLVK